MLVSSFLTFPNISWWMRVVEAGNVLFDAGEHFQKMSYRNRYRISGSNNSILLTVPLESGREQRQPMKEVKIFNTDMWQVQHWRTLVSVYKRTPYFDFYEHSLAALYEDDYTYLVDFNSASIGWVRAQLKLEFTINKTDEFVKEYPRDIIDLRNEKKSNLQTPKYYQVFEDRIGFQPDLSILDLLFSEGPGAVDLLKG
ncbi:MAG: WbqC-like family protein [Flavipsychrobacter sp.]|jgi:hypothetical protein|nr:WbqC-like family protein [Flavipsychrobacter sp.]